MSEITIENKGETYNCDCYIAAEDGFVSSIVVCTMVNTPTGDMYLGAYYGAIGGGENDGGFFRIYVEDSVSEHLDYDDVDNLSNEDAVQASALQALMQKLWILVSEDEGDLELTAEGQECYDPDEDGIWMSEQFDGDFLEDVSGQWKIGLRFER